MNESQAPPEKMLVWIALSELFLDTELRSPDFDRLASLLAAVPFTVDELERILRLEVTPALKASLQSIVGEWLGFDEDWLAARIFEKAERETLSNRKVWRMVRPDWQEIRRRIESIRNVG